MPNWKVLGIICGVCAAPFTGGASLGVCAACVGIGFVGGAVLDKALEDGGNKKINQASPEAYNLLGKSIEELSKQITDLKKEREENKRKENQAQEQLDSIRAKINNPELRQPHETEEYLKKQEVLLISELSDLHKKGDSIKDRLTKLEKTQTNATTTGANAASGSINNANWGNTVDSLKPDFTTKLIIAGIVALIIYFLVIKGK